jgi:valyl-tRNA synthetase
MLPVSQFNFRPYSAMPTEAGAHAGLQEGLRIISEKCRVTMTAPKANVAAEISKSEKILAQLRQRLAALETQVSGATYTQRVPLDVQQKNTAKMDGLKQEIDKIEASLRSLKTPST